MSVFLPMMQPRRLTCGPMKTVVVHYRSMEKCAALHDDVAAEDGVFAQLRAGLDLGVVTYVQRAFEDRVGIDFGAFAHPHAGHHFEALQVNVDLAVEHVSLHLDQAVESSDVLPIGVSYVAKDRRAHVKQSGKHIARPVDRFTRGYMLEDLGLHHVDACVRRVRKNLTPRRFFEEPFDVPVVGDVDNAELERVGHSLQPDRNERAIGMVEPSHLGEVDIRERVAGDHHEATVTKLRLRVLHAPRRAQRLLLGGVLQVHAEFVAVAEIVANQRGEKLNGHDGVGESVSTKQPKYVLHDRTVDDG